MYVHALATDFGWTAVGLGVVGTSIQLRRVAGLGVEGVSMATWLLFTYMGCFWISYGVAAHSWAVVMGSLLVLPLQLGILFRLRPWRHGATAAWSFAFFALTCVVPALVWGWAGGVYGTGVAMTMTRAPQMVARGRYRDASGVSTGSWVLAAVGSVLWIAFYDGSHLWAALVATGVAGAGNVTIAGLSAWRHRQARNDLVRAEVFAVS